MTFPISDISLLATIIKRIRNPIFEIESCGPISENWLKTLFCLKIFPYFSDIIDFLLPKIYGKISVLKEKKIPICDIHVDTHY